MKHVVVCDTLLLLVAVFHRGCCDPLERAIALILVHPPLKILYHLSRELTRSGA